MPTVYLVSGANRGIGLGLVTALASRPETIVFAGARNPASAISLKALEAQYPGNVHVLKLTSADRADNDAALAEIERVAGRLDVVIANAGIAAYFGPAVGTSEEVMLEHFRVNTLGPLVLFQAAHTLLLRAPTPKFVLISSGAGSITTGAAMPVGMLAYGVSKAGANFLVRKLAFEHPSLTCVVISPGGVDTDMAAFASSTDPAMKDFETISVEQSVQGCLKLVDEACREEAGPRMRNYNGTLWEW
ncbi:NAD(P)-binding protein [Calocera viscosa TUFC12733]|uniref:NAD(P)-binding protein n=1 Tax=Calocera viscosa (strain TUFC12733) TaxID=1330018 RepID=A0A167I832_CALVF|nr:NAD(P)-binding protein [Calocera viscosa TUFC12733]